MEVVVNNGQLFATKATITLITNAIAPIGSLVAPTGLSSLAASLRRS